MNKSEISEISEIVGFMLLMCVIGSLVDGPRGAFIGMVGALIGCILARRFVS